ncbi:hypothetical protein SYNTR_0968 [Candidatus Syntrophocurvum alkaliphilum]|uniref:Uncharacterized protein n=2 Tax=Candidatus Syntrophocurvum alkaliphilum TaxID=2293317 RepID=A0A6I6DJH8_9FIRM|nr:hypothetical protein SYNTR_0968 [Candidatus Syntrophocurvum alkaliphilum]
MGDITAEDIQLLNSYHTLSPTGQKELKDYTRYLLCKQYKREVMHAVFQNQIIHNLIRHLLYIVEREEFDISQVEKRVGQIKEIYYGVFEQVHNKYSELIEDLDSHELVKEFGRNSFFNIKRAIDIKNCHLIRLEVVDFSEGFNKFAKNKDARKIVAV